jgi:SUMO ligase MMS21 Smc5/6 complex component
MQKVLELIAITKTKGLALSYMTKKKSSKRTEVMKIIQEKKVIWDLQNGKQGINPQMPTYGTRDCKSTP